MDINKKKHREKLGFLMFAGICSIGFLVIGGFKLMEFTDSPAFCGKLCHTVMYAEYTSYLASPHSRVSCASCHVGPGASYLVKSKISGIPMISATISGKYEKAIPTPVKNLRPAQETCEQCHRPEIFSGDLVRTHTTYQDDENNTKAVDTRILRVGGGDVQAPQGIHWHIGAQVWYVTADEKRQDIGWVGVVDASGNYVSEYTNPQFGSNLTPEIIQKEKRLMDCSDCHNRATHVFRSPGDLMDEAILQGKIDNALPYIKREGTRALYPQNSSLQEADAKVEAIRDFYKNNYAQVFASKRKAIEDAISQLKQIAVLTTFPDQQVNWDTYQSNVGHQNLTGCFRCHGQLIETGGTQKGTTIDVNCDLCHYPITAK
jgi:nitrate/TMAO reductase-like tetraheme cytochrome c subunit